MPKLTDMLKTIQSILAPFVVIAISIILINLFNHLDKFPLLLTNIALILLYFVLMSSILLIIIAYIRGILDLEKESKNITK